MARGIKYEQPVVEPKKFLNFTPLSPLEIKAENNRVIQILEELKKEVNLKKLNKTTPLRIGSVPVTQTIEGFIGGVVLKPLVNVAPAAQKPLRVGKPVGLPGAKAERRAEAFKNYMANRSPEQVAQAGRNEARRMGPPERSTLKVGRKMRTNLDFEKYYPEPPGPVWYPGDVKAADLSYDSILAKRAEDLQATINAEPVRYIGAAKQSPIIPTRPAGKATTATKEMLAKSTLDAIEVVQSRRLGYAAVAVGAGAIYLGNRRRSKKEEI